MKFASLPCNIYFSILYYTLLDITVLCYILYHTILYYTTLYYTINLIYYTTPHQTILYQITLYYYVVEYNRIAVCTKPSKASLFGPFTSPGQEGLRASPLVLQKSCGHRVWGSGFRVFEFRD